MIFVDLNTKEPKTNRLNENSVKQVSLFSDFLYVKSQLRNMRTKSKISIDINDCSVKDIFRRRLSFYISVRFMSDYVSMSTYSYLH